jgi:hypothetical protein
VRKIRFNRLTARILSWPLSRVSGESAKSDALGALLAILNLDKWNCDFTDGYLSEHHRRRQVRKIIAAHLIERNDRLNRYIGLKNSSEWSKSPRSYPHFGRRSL